MDGLKAVPYRFLRGALINAHNVISASAPSLERKQQERHAASRGRSDRARTSRAPAPFSSGPITHRYARPPAESGSRYGIR